MGAKVVFFIAGEGLQLFDVDAESCLSDIVGKVSTPTSLREELNLAVAMNGDPGVRSCLWETEENVDLAGDAAGCGFALLDGMGESGASSDPPEADLTHEGFRRAENLLCALGADAAEG